MALEMKKGSKWWYGRFRDGSKVRQVRLVEIGGERPAKAWQTGDRAFEKSRREAQLKLDQLMGDARGDVLRETIVQRLAEIKTGAKIEFPRLEDLSRLWLELPRRKRPSESYVRQCQGWLDKFVAFVRVQQPLIHEFVAVAPETAKAYMDAEWERGVAPKTWNDILMVLRTTFRQLHPQLTDGSNPFRGLVSRAVETVNREPFSLAELQFILDAAATDEFIRPIVVTAMCTAMRRGDCCQLQWEAVDLDEGFVAVKTSKTGVVVDIPIFPLLREVLERRRDELVAGGTKPDKLSGDVFPAQAEMFQRNNSGISWRGKKVLTEAFRLKEIAEGERPPDADPKEVKRAAGAYIEGLGGTDKAKRMRRVFDLYMTGKGYTEVAERTALTKPTVSAYLNELENATGLKFIRGKLHQAHSSSLQRERKHGLRRASVRDWHSFRVTWITLALASGVPLEIVQRVTGHRTVDVVLTHYFRPGREQFRETIMNAMPALLVGVASPPASRVAGDAVAEQPSPYLYEQEDPPAAKLEQGLKLLTKVTGKKNQALVVEAVELIELAKRRMNSSMVV